MKQHILTTSQTNLRYWGKNNLSDVRLPEINPNFRKTFKDIITTKKMLFEHEKSKDSIFFNSFYNVTKEVYLKSIVSNVIFKGNFVLRAKDSIRVQKSAILEDVILIAPKITFEEGFKGTVQAFATKEIELEQKVSLNYPSVVCVFNENKNESLIKIKQDCKVTGAVVLFGNTMETINRNNIEIDQNGLIFGDIYCSGRLCLKSKIFGSVYTNRFFYKTASSTYDNTIADIEINTTKKPPYFISIPLFENTKKNYGILKKVL